MPLLRTSPGRPLLTQVLRIGALLALSTGAFAQPVAAEAPAAGASAPEAPPATQLKPVEVKGTRLTDTQERRESTAAKIVIGREEIDRYGDSSIGDVLKRLPGVTVQGRPGRGGNARMRGLGSGYTQILLDGQRISPGFALESLTPEQVERIEILRAPTAETGARAIAGTINIVTREGFTKTINELRLTAALENDRLQPSLSWTRNDTAGPFIVNYSLTAFGRDQQSDSTTTTVARRLADDSVTFEQRDEGAVREKRHGVHATGRLQWRGEQGVHSVTLTPLLIYGTGTTQRTGTLTQPVGTAPYDTSATAEDGSFTLLRLNGQWNHRLEQGGRLEWKLGAGQVRNVRDSARTEVTGGAVSRMLDEASRTTDRNLLASGKFVQVLPGDHSLVAGAEAERNQRTERVTSQQRGARGGVLVDEALLTEFGDNLAASSTRYAAYVQDEWPLSPQWGAHAGLRWEGIATQGAGAADAPEATNRSSVWSPLLHAVWKPTPASRDQVRLSLTRSYRAPTLQNLIARPRINARSPTPGPNTPTQPDRAGNPDLKPELATGLDVAVERYLENGGLLSANVFYRQIKNYMRSQTALEDVSWSPGQPRYVARTQNIGAAATQGLELEAKGRLSDWLVGAPKVDLRANASVFRSRVKGVPGPDNRLDQQPDYTANAGADYRVPGMPLTLGGTLNFTPGYDTRISESQTAYQGRKLVADAYALWVFGPAAQVRLTASNFVARDYVTGGELVDTTAGSRETATTVAPTYVNWQLRLELKL